MIRTERESHSRRTREEKWQTCWCCRDQQRVCRMAQASADKLEHTGPAEKEWPQCRRESSWQECRSRLCQKGKKPSVQSTRPWGGGEPRWARERGIRTGGWRGKSEFRSKRRQIPRRKGRASKKSLLSRSRRKHERVSGRKSSPGRSAVLVSLQIWPNLKWEKRLGDEEPAHDRAKWVRVTRRGGREASEKGSGIGEDERQREMARLAAQWRCSNLVILVTLRKGNHPGEA